MVAACAAALLACAPASAAPVTKSDVTITASDGVHLSGDVHLPGAHGRYPAIVDMEPYGRSTSTTYVKDGYAHVNTDVRGSGKSGGALCLLCYREQLDVRDVVEWAARQPWSNGKVVLYGYSYSAITALLGAALEPPHLTAVIVGHPPTDPYRDVIWQNGLYLQGFVAQWFAGQTAAQSVGGPPGAQALDRAQQQFAIETREIPLDSGVYHERSVIDRLKRIKVPTYVFTGWSDMYSRGDMWLIDGLAAKHRLLWIDASTHHGKGRGGQLDAPYDTANEELLALSAEAPKGEVLKWLDRFVKHRRNGIAGKPRVRYFDLGDRTWHHARSWRSVTRKRPELYLSGGRSGTAHSLNDGTLAGRPPKGRASYQESYVYDPTAGSSIPIDREGPDGFLPYAPLDQRFDEPHGLTYTTPPLKHAMHLAGPSELRFWAITEASDMAWVGRLVDVAPDGSARLITSGWLRSSFRRVDPRRSRDGAPYLPDDRQVPVTIGLATKYRMDIWDIAWTLKRGHRLRLWLSSSDSPNHEPLAAAGRNLILHEPGHPSRLILGTRP
ncbi:MAG: CocE/NonD family hydrolase [Thermoleophilaceae bacterium]